MDKNYKWKVLLIIGLVVFSLWKAYPLDKKINLGLDLQGGIRLVFQIDKSKLSDAEKKDVLNRALEVIRNRVDQFGVAEPTIQKQGSDRIIVELPGLKDEEMAKSVIGRTAQLEFMLLREPADLDRAINVIDNAVAGKLPKDTTGAAATATDTAKKANSSVAEKLFKGQEAGKTFPIRITASSGTNQKAEPVTVTGKDGSVKVEIGRSGQ